jgi:hypothetical protein
MLSICCKINGMKFSTFKNMHLFGAVLFFVGTAAQAQVKIGSAGTPNTNAVLELDGGTNKGLLLPKLTNTQIVALTTAPDGLVIFNTTDGFVYIRKNSAWQKITDATNGGGAGFTLPYSGTASTVGGAEFSLTHTSTFGDVAYFNNTAGGSAITTAGGNNKLNMSSGNTGIGIPAGLSENPTLGKLVVRGTAGAVSAMFGDNTAGVSVMNNFPSIGFNYYYNNGSKAISTGFGAALGQDPSTGRIYLSSSATSITGAGTVMPLVDRLIVLANGNTGIATATPLATLHIGRGSTVGGTAQFDGTTYSSHFNYNTTEETYIRGGKATSQVIINDLSTGNVRLAEGGGNVGIGIAIPSRPLSFPAAEGKKISLYPGATGDVGLSVEPNELRMYTDNSNAIITMGYDNFNSGFKETFRINPWGTLVATNPVTLGANVENGFYFKTSSRYTGAIKTIGVDGFSARTGFFGFASVNPANLREYMSISDAGFVGIGNTAPTRPLSFPAVLGKKISLYPGATGDVGFAVFANELRINSDNASADITFGYDNFSSGFTERMRIKGNGSVGIGNTDPAFPLDITGRVRLRNVGSSNTAGIWLDGTTAIQRSFVGTNDNNTMGLYGTGSGWSFLMDVNDGAIMIGTAQKAAGYKVNVAGKVIAEEVRVQLRAAWPDYVFENNYKKLSLEELEQYVIINKHLPNIPSALDIEKDGQQLGEVQRKMLEKIEELSLYIIEQDKRIKILEANK